VALGVLELDPIGEEVADMAEKTCTASSTLTVCVRARIEVAASGRFAAASRCRAERTRAERTGLKGHAKHPQL
jgi:hypothetical protein